MTDKCSKCGAPIYADEPLPEPQWCLDCIMAASPDPSLSVDNSALQPAADGGGKGVPADTPRHFWVRMGAATFCGKLGCGVLMSDETKTSECRGEENEAILLLRSLQTVK